MKKLLTLLSVTIGITAFGQVQNVGINTTGSTPDASAMLDIDATDKGLLIPRLSLTATNVASPVTSPTTSLLVYNDATAGSGTTAVTPGYYYWNVDHWERIIITANVSTIINDSLVTNVYPFINNNTSTINNILNDLSTHLANDQDSVVGNEFNTNFTESNGDITITDGGGSMTVSITNTIANQINDSLVTNVYPLINNNTTNINNLTTQVTTNTTNIANNTTDISNLTTQVSTNTTNISNLTTQVNTNTTNITNNTSDITYLYSRDLDTVVGNEWTIVGNAGTTPGTNFVGTTDNVGLQFQTNSTERFNITSDGALLYNSTTGATPTSGAGTRMMWIPEKGSFRAGTVTGTQWDNGNIGNNSFATGQDNIAGDRSIVGGISNTAASSSLAIGNTNTVGSNSIIAGQNNAYNNINGIVVGSGNNHLGGTAWVLGQSNTTYNRGFYAGINNTFSAGSNSGSVYVIGNNNLGTSANVQGLVIIGNKITMPSSNGNESILIGTRVTAAHDNATVIGNTGTAFPNTTSWGTQTLTMAHLGGTRIYSSLANGVELAAGSTVWSSISDSTLKTNITLLDYGSVLDKLDNVPVKKWSYITQTPEGQDKEGLDPEQIYTEPIFHIGPMAQDFYAAFGLDIAETRITSLDLAGVSLAGVKALKEENETLEEEILLLKKELEELKALVYEIKK